MRFKPFYRRNLPHIQPAGFIFFITTRLAGSLPRSVTRRIGQKFTHDQELIETIQDPDEKYVQQCLLREKHVTRIDDALHKIENGPMYLADPNVACAFIDQLRRFDQQFYDLIAFSVMPNHVHFLIDTRIQMKEVENRFIVPEDYFNLDQILKRIKGASAREANLVLNRTGKFWQSESFDVYIRNENMYWNIIRYILMNPVKAGIVEQWRDHPFTWVCGECDPRNS